MSQKTKRIGRSLAEQSKREKVLVTTIESVDISKKEDKSIINRLNKLGLEDLLEEFDENKIPEIQNFIYEYGKYLLEYESIYNKKYRLKAVLEILKIMSDSLESSFKYINGIELDDVILLYHLYKFNINEYENNEEIIDYVMNRANYFSQNTFEGKSRLIEFIEYIHDKNGNISELDKDEFFDLGAPTDEMNKMKASVLECQLLEKSVSGVEGLGHCTNCGSNVLIITEIQDRCADEQKSVYVSCANCSRRGANIVFDK